MLRAPEGPAASLRLSIGQVPGLMGDSFPAGARPVYFPPGGEAPAANPHAAPTPPSSSRPPTIAVSPPADMATATPCPAGPTAPAPTSLLPSTYQASDLRT